MTNRQLDGVVRLCVPQPPREKGRHMSAAGERTRLGILAVSLSVVAATAAVPPAAYAAGSPTGSAVGSLTVLTYNVAGLPEPLSGSKPAKNTKVISQRINSYDIVNVQEDFAYHADLIKHDEHPYRTPPSVPEWVPVPGVPFSDGLNTLSDFKLRKLDRVTWDRCAGYDCLTPKGFTYLRLELPGGTSLDLYNAHMNAGSGTEKKLRVRRDNVRQLSDYIKKHSADRAVIVTGDTNSRYTRPGDIIRELRDDNGLTDAWVQLVKGGTTPEVDESAPTCKESAECELLDKVFYRSGPGLTLDAVRYGNEYAEFLDSKGKPLSDHNPPAVTFTFTRGEEAADG
ncbi:endonuclease/exonuclease/phosphatase family protein [Streptomyces sp. MUM 178J]|uniref:endonuclease/exonuclease/phosphatase family protein n=1 Tax=Streptomyces sp. MUM 178J TaxID=2791991 RepID=UPI001F047B6B|nr:endonuclease/exonuclease/phosphatase family protein [Streptomyces sp. MUM 178J]WRQ81754.1 endonuclease/exonuclease/phosphatase family protein [Streptomyces sp. MUM 178J]